MNINYPVGDFLIRLKNAAIADRKEVVVDKTKLIVALAEALKKEGFLEKVEVKEGKLLVSLKFRRKEPVLIDIKLVSRPGLRVYIKAEELAAKRGASITVLSTPGGIMMRREALKKRMGGELIAEIF